MAVDPELPIISYPGHRLWVTPHTAPIVIVPDPQTVPQLHRHEAMPPPAGDWLPPNVKICKYCYRPFLLDPTP